MVRLRLWCLAGVAIWSAIDSPWALAREKTDPVPPEARQHYEKGISRYHLGDFEAAITEFRAAYELTKAPRLLFDIAQAQRLKKDYEAALYSYTTYLRLQPEAPNRVDVASRIAEMSRLVAAERERLAVEVPPSPAPIVEPPPSPQPNLIVVEPAPLAPTPGEMRGARAKLWGGIGASIGGAVLFAAAAGLTGQAASQGEDLRRLQMAGGVWSQYYQDLYDGGRRNQAAAAALWGIGGAVAVIGVVSAILGSRELKRLSLRASSHGLSVSWFSP
jgi:tetratricopeptide (TPR) repeat protein